MSASQTMTKDGLRALFAIGVTQDFSNASNDEIKEVSATLKQAFKGLGERFGVRVLGTIDDDLLQCGENHGYPWMAYIMAEIPNLEAAIEVTNLARTPYKQFRLAKYIRIEARIGRPLFFGQE